MVDLPLDIKPVWFNVIRRLQATCAEKDGGIGIIHISIMIDENNNPIVWTSPRLVKIEPKSKAQELLKSILDT